MSDGEVVWVATGWSTGNWVEGATAMAAIAEYGAQYGCFGTVRLAKCQRDGDMAEYSWGAPCMRDSYDRVSAWALSAR